MNEPKEPPYPADRKPHSERIADIVRLCPVEQTVAVCIDDTPEHRAYYSHHLGKAPRIKVVFEGVLSEGVYMYKITKESA